MTNLNTLACRPHTCAEDAGPGRFHFWSFDDIDWSVLFFILMSPLIILRVFVVVVDTVLGARESTHL